MKKSSKQEDDETAHGHGIQTEPIIVDHPPKSDPRLLDTVLKVSRLSYG